MSESIASTFKCYKCGNRSEYQKRHTEMFMEWVTVDRLNAPETRTYECTACGASNEISMLPMQWDLIIHANR
jgi:DNA-directed RNA polymerase subunit RPC12/RpoP